MRLRFFLCASADLGVRRSKVEISFCRSGYIGVSGELRPDDRPLDLIWAVLNRPVGVPNILKRDLQSKLNLSRFARMRHAAEVGAVAEVAVRIQELRVVEYVEKLRSE